MLSGSWGQIDKCFDWRMKVSISSADLQREITASEEKCQHLEEDKEKLVCIFRSLGRF